MPDLTTPDGRTLAYEIRGSGEPLVCHPGGPGLSAAILGDLGGLDRSSSLILLDPRGTGGSDPPSFADAYALADYVADVETLRDHLGLERIDLLGHSHGSLVGIQYAAEHPERVQRLVLYATGTRFHPEQLQALQAAIAERSGEPWFEDALEALQTEPEPGSIDDHEMGRLMARALPFYFANYGEAERAFVAEMAQRPLHAAALIYWDANEFRTFDMRPFLPRVTASTLVVGGEHDFILGPDGCRAVADGIAGARLELLDGVGHLGWIEAPERFAAPIRDFLANS
jgi:pimeloyl-ACP methyl ester carboxylesterase